VGRDARASAGAHRGSSLEILEPGAAEVPSVALVERNLELGQALGRARAEKASELCGPS